MTTTIAQPQGAIQIVQPQQVQAVQVNTLEPVLWRVKNVEVVVLTLSLQNTTPATAATTAQPPVMIQQSAVQPPSPTQAQQGGIQIVQQIVTPTGEVQQIPVSID